MMEQLGEFAGGLIEIFVREAYKWLYPYCSNLYNSTVNVLNSRINETAGRLGQDLESWNAGAFNIVRAAAENVCIPIAGAIFGFIFTWELVSMVQDHNYKENVRPERVILTLVRLLICLMVCINSFNIVMFLYRIGGWAVNKLGATANGTFNMGGDFTAILDPAPSQYNLGTLIGILGVFLGLCVAWVVCHTCAYIVYIQVLMWFIDMAVYAASAPIPFATFLNRDWSQTGMNYGKKVFAIGLRGFFILLFICVYGGMINSISGTTFMETIVMLCGGAIALIIFISKASHIADSILNTH